MQQEFAGTIRTGGPALRRFGDHANGLGKLARKLRVVGQFEVEAALRRHMAR